MPNFWRYARKRCGFAEAAASSRGPRDGFKLLPGPRQQRRLQRRLQSMRVNYERKLEKLRNDASNFQVAFRDQVTSQIQGATKSIEVRSCLPPGRRSTRAADT